MDHPFLSHFQFFLSHVYQFATSRGWINTAPLDPPFYSFIRYFLLKIITVRHAYTYTTNSLTGFLFLCRYYSSYHKHVHHVQSVSQSVSYFFFASSHCALAFSVFTAIRQSKPYTATFFYSIVWCIAIFFYSIHHFVPHMVHVP
jgi:hypothetical protein